MKNVGSITIQASDSGDGFVVKTNIYEYGNVSPHETIHKDISEVKVRVDNFVRALETLVRNGGM